MKYFSLLALLAFSLSASASELKLECEVKHNFESVFTTQVSLKPGTKNLLFGSFDMYDFFISSLEDGKAELQVYDRITPSRTYSVGYLAGSSPSLEQTLWSRELILEARCSLQ